MILRNLFHLAHQFQSCKNHLHLLSLSIFLMSIFQVQLCQKLTLSTWSRHSLWGNCMATLIHFFQNCSSPSQSKYFPRQNTFSLPPMMGHTKACIHTLQLPPPRHIQDYSLTQCNNQTISKSLHQESYIFLNQLKSF